MASNIHDVIVSSGLSDDLALTNKWRLTAAQLKRDVRSAVTGAFVVHRDMKENKFFSQFCTEGDYCFSQEIIDNQDPSITIPSISDIEKLKFINVNK